MRILCCDAANSDPEEGRSTNDADSEGTEACAGQNWNVAQSRLRMAQP
jgi:hypothetical protein